MSGSKLMADIDSVRRSVEGLNGKIPSTVYNAIMSSVSELYKTGYEVAQKSASNTPTIPPSWLKRPGSMIFEYPVFLAEFSKMTSNATLSTHWDELCHCQDLPPGRVSSLRRLFRNMCGFSLALVDLDWAVRYAEKEVSEQIGQLLIERAAVSIQEAVISLSRAGKDDIFICRYKRPNVLAVLVRWIDLELFGQALDSANAQMVQTNLHDNLFHTSFAFTTCDMVEAQERYSHLPSAIRNSLGSRQLCPSIMLAMAETYILLSVANDGLDFLAELDVLKEEYYLRGFSPKNRKSYQHAVSQFESAGITRNDSSMRARHLRDECFSSLLIGLVPTWINNLKQQLQTDPENQVTFMVHYLLSELYYEWFPNSSRNLVLAR